MYHLCNSPKIMNAKTNLGAVIFANVLYLTLYNIMVFEYVIK